MAPILLAGCPSQPVGVAPPPPTEAIPIDPSHAVTPDYADYSTRPRIALYVEYQPNRYVLISTDGVLIPRRCVFVSSPFRLVVTAKDVKGVGLVQVGNPLYSVNGVQPPGVIFSGPSAIPAPDSPTQTADLAPGPYPNPGAWNGSRTVEVNYQVTSLNHIYDNALLNVGGAFAPDVAPQNAYAPISITAKAASPANSSIDGFVLRLAGPSDRAGADCPWPDVQ